MQTYKYPKLFRGWLSTARIRGLHSPTQSRCMHGRIPEALHLLVKHRYRRRTTCHIERCDEIADQRSRNDGTGWFEQSADGIIHQIKLRKRRRSEAVDQQDGLAARALAKIGSDGV